MGLRIIISMSAYFLQRKTLLKDQLENLTRDGRTTRKIKANQGARVSLEQATYRMGIQWFGRVREFDLTDLL